MMLRRVGVILFSSVLVVAPMAVWAQTTEPSSVAASRPAPADPNSPRGALKALVTALKAGDVNKIKSVIATTNPTEDKMVDAMATMEVATQKLRTAAQAAYGDSAKDLTGDTDAQMAAGLAVIDAAPETINGDTATVAVDPKGQPKTLKKIDGQWRIPIGEVFSGVDEAAVQQRLDDMADLSKMMGQTADEINAGKYKTPKDAEEAIDSRIMASTMRQAATQPGTAPPDAPSTEPAPTGM